jgi:hypothetical protein
MVKKIALLTLLAAGVLSAANYSGTWNGKGMVQDTKYGGLPHSAQLTLIQSGSSLQGTLKVDNGQPMRINVGSVSDGKISFGVHMQATQITGQLSDNNGQLTGRLTSSSGQVFAVTFIKQ